MGAVTEMTILTTPFDRFCSKLNAFITMNLFEIREELLELSCTQTNRQTDRQTNTHTQGKTVLP
jgi:hypothetical protein